MDTEPFPDQLKHIYTDLNKLLNESWFHLAPDSSELRVPSSDYYWILRAFKQCNDLSGSCLENSVRATRFRHFLLYKKWIPDRGLKKQSFYWSWFRGQSKSQSNPESMHTGPVKGMDTGRYEQIGDHYAATYCRGFHCVIRELLQNLWAIFCGPESVCVWVCVYICIHMRDDEALNKVIIKRMIRG